MEAVLDARTLVLNRTERTHEEAGMRLLTTPKKPPKSALLTTSFKVRYESWSKFLSRAYWEVELEP